VKEDIQRKKVNQERRLKTTRRNMYWKKKENVG